MCAMRQRHADAAGYYLEALALIDELRVPCPPKEPGLELSVVGPRGFRDGTARQVAAAAAAQVTAAEAGPARAEAEAPVAVVQLSGGEPLAMDGVARPAARPAVGTGAQAATAPIGPLDWGADAVAASMQPAEAVDGGQQLDLWVRLELSKPRRLSQLRFRLERPRVGGPLQPCRCSLWASAGSDGGGVFVEVARFELDAPTAADACGDGCGGCRSNGDSVNDSSGGGGDGSGGNGSGDGGDSGGSDRFAPVQTFDFYRPHKSKHYRLNVHSVHTPPAGGAGASGGVAGASGGAMAGVRLAEMRLMEAEIEVDYMQLLHTAHNLAGALQYDVSAGARRPRQTMLDESARAPTAAAREVRGGAADGGGDASTAAAGGGDGSTAAAGGETSAPVAAATPTAERMGGRHLFFSSDVSPHAMVTVVERVQSQMVGERAANAAAPVSYTHLTLPTICSV
eukprot:895438-Prymnesium_polylepis.2